MTKVKTTPETIVPIPYQNIPEPLRTTTDMYIKIALA